MNRLFIKHSVSKTGKSQRDYFSIDSQNKKKRIGSSTRVTNWDSEKETLEGFLAEGLTNEDIKNFSKRVTVGNKIVNPRSMYLEKEKQSEIRLQLFKEGKLIQTITLGNFPDKYIGFYNAHQLACGILENDLREVQVCSGRIVQINEEFYKTSAERDLESIPEIDLEFELSTLNEELQEKNSVLLKLQCENAELKKENNIFKIQHDEDKMLLDWYRYEYMEEKVIKCPDCGEDMRRLWSKETGKYFLGCSSGKHHTPKPYDKMARVAFKEGLIRDIWVENSEDPEYYYSHDYVKGSDLK